MSRSTLRSAKRVRELPACSKQAQKTTLKVIRIIITMMRSRCTLSPLKPSRNRLKQTNTSSPIRIQKRMPCPKILTSWP